MGKESGWRYSGLNRASNVRPPDIRQQSMNSMVFPTYANPFGCAFPGNAPAAFPGFGSHKFLQRNSASIPPLNPSGFAAAQKKFLVFDQSGDQTNLVFSSVGDPFPDQNPFNLGAELPWSDGTNVSDGHGGEEMHEDTEEIDALLYSDSEDEHEEDEASTGHSPFETMTPGSRDEVATLSTVPAKRRRVDAGLEASLTDTASSGIAHHRVSQPDSSQDEDDAVSSCVGGGGERDAPNHGSKRLKRERIQETVCVLRRIIPGGRGKDAAAVLDDAIRYLRSLKLKAKALGTATIL